MTLLTAISIIEDLYGEESTEDELLEAWSFIGRTGAYLQLQGFYGRTLANLIEEGILDEHFNIIES